MENQNEERVTFQGPEGVPCEIHGKTPAMFMYLNGEEEGKYCFLCYNDFLAKNLKNYQLKEGN